MTTRELMEMLRDACDDGFDDTEVDVVTADSSVDSGCPVVGLRCVRDSIDNKIKLYVSIVES